MPKEKKRPGFMNYFDDWDLPRQLFNAEDFHRFYCAVYDYARDGKLPEELPTKELRLFFENFKIKMDNDENRYQEVCQKRSEAGKKAYLKKEAANAGYSQPTSTSISDSNQNQIQYHHQHQTQPQYQRQPQYAVDDWPVYSQDDVSDDPDLPF